MSFIWATRGRSWGFRFLRDGSHHDPLPYYEHAFSGAPSGTTCHRAGTTVAVRFLDPLGRQDAAGRPIPHEFVLIPPLSDGVDTVDDALEKVWPLVEQEYADVWQKADGTPSHESG
ncbi:hypothetical protein [Nocardioides marmoraquaticus]